MVQAVLSLVNSSEVTTNNSKLSQPKLMQFRLDNVK